MIAICVFIIDKSLFWWYNILTAKICPHERKHKMSEIKPQNAGLLLGRGLEFFHHDSEPEWGYVKPQRDTFAVLHPENEQAGGKYPLYVVFHSAGHDVYSCIGCTWAKGNHDIYHAPAGMFALYLDCRANSLTGTDWWWGGIDAHGDGDPAKGGQSLQPVEKRVMATIDWVMENYPIDRERVYAVGNSMGGSGALGIAMRRGDIFAAVKVNVPAGVRHFADRCGLDGEAPETLPEMPLLVDYSAQNDGWSEGHGILYRGMREKKYALIGYWGNFGHANNNEVMEKENDLIHSFDIFTVKKNEAYPVFTNASTDDADPWEQDIKSTAAGQVNSFFRWRVLEDSADIFRIELRLLRQDEWKSRVEFPLESTADVSLRRLQRFAKEGDLSWSFGGAFGKAEVAPDGRVDIGRLTITTEPVELVLKHN